MNFKDVELSRKQDKISLLSQAQYNQILKLKKRKREGERLPD